MAKAERNFLGDFSGRLGPLVYYKWKGKPCVRTLPQNYTDTLTPERLAQRRRMILVNAFTQPFTSLVRITLEHLSKTCTAYNMATSLNMKHALQGTSADEMYLDLNKTLLTYGDLVLPEKAGVEKRDAGYVFNWDTSPGENTDTVLLVALHKEKHLCDFWFSGASRSQGAVSWQPRFNDGDCHFWMAFRSQNEKQWSNSLYLVVY